MHGQESYFIYLDNILEETIYITKGVVTFYQMCGAVELYSVDAMKYDGRNKGPSEQRTRPGQQPRHKLRETYHKNTTHS